jgi:hypothetical protein
MFKARHRKENMTLWKSIVHHIWSARHLKALLEESVLR